MGFTDGNPRVATESDIVGKWSGGKPGECFRCYLCGYKFCVGDIWRFVYDNDGNGAGFGNFLVCSKCDCDNVRENWKQHINIAVEKYWFLMPRQD